MQVKLSNICPEGYPFILIFCVVTIIAALISPVLMVICLILTAWCVMFFRDPERVTPQDPSLVIAPADGKIIKIEKAFPPEELELKEEMTKISIFMNVFNVHVNRAPCPGTITKIHYHEGKFFNASLDKASEHNERQSFAMKTTSNDDVAFVQIAGLVARRIVKFTKENTDVKAGHKVGLIKFGSRVDVYLPAKTAIKVHEGQTTIGGETVLASFSEKAAVIEAEVLDRP